MRVVLVMEHGADEKTGLKVCIMFLVYVHGKYGDMMNIRSSMRLKQRRYSYCRSKQC